jgi:hypothetical protein
MKALLVFLFLLPALHASAQSIVISDVDDTLKFANVASMTGSVKYFRDAHSNFTGMTSLFQLVRQDNESSFYYVSNAPEWLMKSTHLKFLKNLGFPNGPYIGRTRYSADVHKLIHIRSIIRKAHPKRVLFVGDNSEIDAKVYATIAKEFASAGIEFTQYIHILYTSSDLKHPMTPLAPEQIGYVTSVEVAEDLAAKNWLSFSSVQWMKKNILPRILNERPGADSGAHAFPDFKNCQDIEWRWNIPGLNEKISEACGI